MSGTSLDGVDGVLVDFSGMQPSAVTHASLPFPVDLKAEFLALNTAGNNELHRAALAGNALVRLYARVVNDLLLQSGRTSDQVAAIGAHGQTVRHRPTEFDGTGYTLQVNNPSLLAELCGIDVVADFRSRDVAAGGQGAPLVPPFHQSFFGGSGQVAAVLNIGGIANITHIQRPFAADGLRGYDCGPGNALMDAWCTQHTGAAFDDNGAWAAFGSINDALLASMLTEPFFALRPPKSTGRDLFNWSWLQHKLAECGPCLPVDVQATLTELTALGCARCLDACPEQPSQVLVCGGGALNGYLMQRLQVALPNYTVNSTALHGLPPLQVEATAFAWLARQAMVRKTASLESVTGARGARILGAIYPA
ncbi:anhydro-N-acetylmuramic acid kinase [Rhodoferax aquaticus]